MWRDILKGENCCIGKFDEALDDMDGGSLLRTAYVGR